MCRSGVWGHRFFFFSQAFNRPFPLCLVLTPAFWYFILGYSMSDFLCSCADFPPWFFFFVYLVCDEWLSLYGVFDTGFLFPLLCDRLVFFLHILNVAFSF